MCNIPFPVNKNSAVIFDMDGVLIDTEPVWAKIERKVFTALGVIMSEENVKASSRLTTKEATEFWYNLHPWSHPTLERVEQSVIDQVGAWILEHGEAMDGVEETLSYFKSTGCKIGLATNSPMQIVRKVMERLQIECYFDAITSADDVNRGKPDPEIYHLARKELEVLPENCMVFEDSITGLTAAKLAGLKTVWVHSDAPHQTTEYADHKIPDFFSLKS